MVLIGILDVDNFFKIFGQTLHPLTYEKTYMHYILARREYDVEDLVALLLPLSK
jgi:hypothetical protein